LGIVAPMLAALSLATAAVPPPKVAAVVVIGMDPSDGPAEELRTLVRGGLASEGGVKLLDVNVERATFAAPRPKSSQASLQKAQRLLAKAEANLRDFELKEAETAMASVAELLAPYLGLRETTKIDQERLHLGVAIAHAQRDEARIDALLADYVTRYPGVIPDERKWPPDLVRRLSTGAPTVTTKLEIASTPSGTAYVDGRLYGPTPTTATDLPPGRHRVEVDAEGSYPIDGFVDTTSLETTKIELKPLPRVSASLAKAKIDQPLDRDLASELRRLATPLGVTELVFVSKGPKSTVELRSVSVDNKGDESPKFAGDRNEAGARLAISQWRAYRERPSSTTSTGVPTWAWVGAGSGAALTTAGVVLRMIAVGTENELQRKEGASTQSEAFNLRDQADAQALGGSILIGVGFVALAGVGAYVLYGQLGSEP
jgi:hypothetical protein